jgi:hypothetical protein
MVKYFTKKRRNKICESFIKFNNNLFVQAMIGERSPRWEIREKQKPSMDFQVFKDVIGVKKC